ncbi:hypothetical protein SHO565_60040 [Streptomyces sp. HO565]
MQGVVGGLPDRCEHTPHVRQRIPADRDDRVERALGGGPVVQRGDGTPGLDDDHGKTVRDDIVHLAADARSFGSSGEGRPPVAFPFQVAGPGTEFFLIGAAVAGSVSGRPGGEQSEPVHAHGVPGTGGRIAPECAHLSRTGIAGTVDDLDHRVGQPRDQAPVVRTARWEKGLSPDYGRSWELNWVMDLARTAQVDA